MTRPAHMTQALPLQHDAPIPTWFGIGGRADTLARPRDDEELLRCLEMDPEARVLGEGANLLVHDAGVSGLVISLGQPAFKRVEQLPGREGQPDSEVVIVRAGAGVHLPKLVIETVRWGLAGLEGLAGIPATLGGALVMNAGGVYGEIAEAVGSVFVMDRAGVTHRFARTEIAFGYRRSGLGDSIVTGCELELRREDPARLRERLKEVMAYKSATQPMCEKSAGCCFKNPILPYPLDGIGHAGERVSAGLVIDRAGCKGLSRGGASVSTRHANFFPVKRGAHAVDVIALMEEVEHRVADRFGLRLEREIVLWRRDNT